MGGEEYDRFRGLTYDRFRSLAKDTSLSPFEKIGFPNSYREGAEERIFRDIESKLSTLRGRNKTILDVGPGCSGLPVIMIDVCRRNDHTLILIDSAEMLNHLPDGPGLIKIPAFYPRECQFLFDKYAQKIDAILAYSILHYIFAEHNIFDFLDKSMSLLTPGGEMLIGDIPNISKRKRLFSSAAGIAFHQTFTGTAEIPAVSFNNLEQGQIDDSVIVSLVMRARTAGFDAYLVPQSESLPLANRREDILIRRP